MFGSDDYLDLATHPKVKEAAVQAILKYGGRVGSRLLDGTLDLHVKLEAELAAFAHKEAAIIFASDYQANYSISALAEKGDVMLYDHSVHASLVEAALRSTALIRRFRHNDIEHLRLCLASYSPEDRILVLFEGVFSMEGDNADLHAVVELSMSYGARTYVDEAEGIGVIGPTGAGIAEHLGVLDDVDIVSGTFTKSLASYGGFIASKRTVIEYIKHTARPLVFSASLPAPYVAAAAVALQIVKDEPERREHLVRIASILRTELKARGFRVLKGQTGIVSVLIADETDLCRLSKRLLCEGIYVNAILRPAAAQNLLRISVTAAHSEQQAEHLVNTLGKAAAALAIEP